MGCISGKPQVTIRGNKFYVQDQIAQGGFSSVYLVKDAYNAEYVLKCIPCHDHVDHSRAFNEAKIHQILQSLENNYILNFLECEMIEKTTKFTKTPTDMFVILLPYCKNGSLQDYLVKPEFNTDLKRVLNHFQTICLGVKTFHDLGYAHRDIKPANILFNDGDQPVIIDLGSAVFAKVMVTTQKAVQELLDDVNQRCSMAYRAPELFNIEVNSVLDERVDIWSLGCLLYAMLYQKSPFDSVHERGDSVALAVMSGNVYFPPDGNKRINDFIKTLLTVDHFERPSIYSVLKLIKELCESYDQTYDEHEF